MDWINLKEGDKLYNLFNFENGDMNPFKIEQDNYNVPIIFVLNQLVTKIDKLEAEIKNLKK